MQVPWPDETYWLEGTGKEVSKGEMSGGGGRAHIGACRPVLAPCEWQQRDDERPCC